MYDPRLRIYQGPKQPEWNPRPDNIEINAARSWQEYGNFAYNYDLDRDFGQTVLQLNTITRESAQDLIDQFEAQEHYPVSVSGYPDDANVGSHRAMAWAPELAEKLDPLFRNLPNYMGDKRNFAHMFPFDDRNQQPLRSPFDTGWLRHYDLLGSTPWMRFMKYDSGGEHVPHYDAPFRAPDDSYVTLYSWVMYLNDVDDDAGGHFQFVNDGNAKIHPQDRPVGSFGDWHEMAPAKLITMSVQPRAGTLLIFPHWLCHQVQQLTSGVRYIIRGDVAYGIGSETEKS